MPTFGAREEGTSHQSVEDISREIRKYVKNDFTLDVHSDIAATIYLQKRDISRLLSQRGKAIKSLERSLKMRLSVQSTEEHNDNRDILAFSSRKTKSFIVLDLKGHQLEDVDIEVDGDPLLSVRVSKGGSVRVSLDSEVGRALQDGISRNNVIVKRRG